MTNSYSLFVTVTPQGVWNPTRFVPYDGTRNLESIEEQDNGNFLIHLTYKGMRPCTQTEEIVKRDRHVVGYQML
jgi:hypothetical protein